MSSDYSKIFVTTLDLKLKDKILQDLESQNFEISTPPYTVFLAKKKGVACTLYNSGKLTVQGKDAASFIEFYLEPEILKSFPVTYQQQREREEPEVSHIGIDESGKGDFFGPLCIAGVYATKEEIKKLKLIGVRDSKALSDDAICKLGKKIKLEFQHHIVKINPLKYNELYEQFKNLNTLLAWGHATAIEGLVLATNCQTAIIDQFANEHVVIRALSRKKLKIDLTQRHKGEEDPVVAAASILARLTFLEGLSFLEKECGFKLPKGASKQTIVAGKKIYGELGLDGLKKVGKLHFKTFNAILHD